MNRDNNGIAYEGYKKPKHFGYIEIKTGDVVYMRRWYLFRCKWFSIRLHHIMREDWDVWPHDHPWNFLSIILRGGYWEEWCKRHEFMTTAAGDQWVPSRYSHRRRFNYKFWEDLHKIVLFDREGKGSWTLVITGREQHTWGFMTREGFKTHKELATGDLSEPY